MPSSPAIRSLSVLAAVAGLSLISVLSSCSWVADKVSTEAAIELANEVRDDVLDVAADRSLATDSVTVLGVAVRGVILSEQLHEDTPHNWVPHFEGLIDADGDGADDDGRVEIIVRNAHACVVIVGDGAVYVERGAC